MYRLSMFATLRKCDILQPQPYIYRKAYGDPVHLKVEDMKAASTRSGKSKTHSMKTAKLNDTLTSAGADEEALPASVQDIDEWYNHNQSTGNVSLVQASSSSSTGVTDCLPSAGGADSQILVVSR
ncbi:hypothetical protein EDB19DRAFT_1825929 [Suillus lakei]|nr:hypothetical protein EDB19DRAFT_1825929 [Suillus lakei]